MSNSTEQRPCCEADTSSASQEISLHFMEPEGSLPHAKQPAIYAYEVEQASSIAWKYSCVISGFRRRINEIFARLGCYAA